MQEELFMGKWDYDFSSPSYKNNSKQADLSSFLLLSRPEFYIRTSTLSPLTKKGDRN